MSDHDLRALERQAEAGDDAAARRLVEAHLRREDLAAVAAAVRRFGGGALEAVTDLTVPSEARTRLGFELVRSRPNTPAGGQLGRAVSAALAERLGGGRWPWSGFLGVVSSEGGPAGEIHEQVERALLAPVREAVAALSDEWLDEVLARTP